jgi:hypothetical protein
VKLLAPIDRDDRRYRYVSLSPNGHWVLSMESSDHPQWVVRELEGTRCTNSPPHRGNRRPLAAWLPDSRGWVEVAWDARGAHLWVHRIGTARATERIDVSAVATAEEVLVGHLSRAWPL